MTAGVADISFIVGAGLSDMRGISRPGSALVWGCFVGVVAGISVFMCLGNVGLVLDFLGAVVLISPYLPRLRYVILRIPLPPFTDLKTIEEEYKEQVAFGVTLSPGESGHALVNMVFKRQWGNSFRNITLQQEQNQTWHVSVTDNPREGYADVEIQGSRYVLRQFLDTPIEWQC